MLPFVQTLGQPLLADAGDIIGLIIWVVIILISVISKLAGGAKKAPPRRQQQPAGRPAGQPQAKAGAKSIESEIEDFLRQARSGQQQPQQARNNPEPDRPPRPPQRQPPQRQPAQPQRQRPQPARPQGRPATPVVDAVPADQDIVPGKDFARDLTEHVAEHIGNDSISQRDAHLGDYVEEADERIEHHLEEVFAHDVGHLAHTENVDTSIAEGTDAADKREEERNAAAVRIRELLSSQDSIREVFIASEILKRPDI